MHVVQLLDTFAHGDAIGNDVMAIQDLIRSWGWSSSIVARSLAPGADDSAILADRFDFSKVKDGITLFHHSIGTALIKTLRKIPGKRLLVYHNVTPSHYFKNVNPLLERLAASGRAQLRAIKPLVHGSISDSHFNKEDLTALGFEDNTVIPILVDLGWLDRIEADRGVLNRYGKGTTANWMFVGRLAPNKRQDDAMRVFARYHHAINSDSRLILVGHGAGMEVYVQKLQALALQLGISRAVVFSGHVSASQLVAYYRVGHLFACMSDHEGFCVPLLESMHFGMPILAHAAGAVPETLGGTGILAKTKDPVILAEMANLVLEDSELSLRLVARQKDRLKAYSAEIIGEMWRERLGAPVPLGRLPVTT